MDIGAWRKEGCCSVDTMAREDDRDRAVLGSAAGRGRRRRQGSRSGRGRPHTAIVGVAGSKVTLDQVGGTAGSSESHRDAPKGSVQGVP